MTKSTESVASLVGRLFIIIDPIGNIPLFLALLRGIEPKRSRRIILRELSFALIAMALFALCGAQLLSALGIDQRSIGVSGGLILFLIALKMLFPSSHGAIAQSSDGEPFLFPLAIPLVAGPSMLVTLIELSEKAPWQAIFPALFTAWALCTLILLAAAQLQRFLGDQGVAACERIMGLVLLFISAQMFLSGLTDYFHRPQTLNTLVHHDRIEH